MVYKGGFYTYSMKLVGLSVLAVLLLLPAASAIPVGVKPPIFQNGTNTYYTGMSSPAETNTGVWGIISVLPQTFGNGNGGCLSFWVSDNSFKDQAWGQVGYYICNGGPPLGFYQLWNVTTGANLGANTVTIGPYGNYNFSMYVSSGTTWTFAISGTILGTYNFGSNTPGGTEPIYAMSEQGGVASPQFFYSVFFPSALNVKENGVWIQPALSQYGNSWDIQQLVPNMLEIGYPIPN